MTDQDPPKSAETTPEPGGGTGAPAGKDPPPGFRHWPMVTVAAVVAIFSICAALWHVAMLRPTLVAGGTGLAAFLGPLPGLLSPEMRGKWIISIIIAALITAGTGLATTDLSDRLLAAETRSGQLAERLSSLNDSVEDLIKDQPALVRDALFRSSGDFYKGRFRAGRYQTILDLTAIMLAVAPENGHSLYYAGETERVLGNKTDMIGNFQNYIAWADHHPESRDGDAAECYRRSSGYCQERLGWIDHEMANHYLTEAKSRKGAAALSFLQTALAYEQDNLAVRPGGFNADAGMRSSCDVLGEIKQALSALRQNTGTVDALRDKLGAYCKGP